MEFDKQSLYLQKGIHERISKLIGCKYILQGLLKRGQVTATWRRDKHADAEDLDLENTVTNALFCTLTCLDCTFQSILRPAIYPPLSSGTTCFANATSNLTCEADIWWNRPRSFGQEEPQQHAIAHVFFTETMSLNLASITRASFSIPPSNWHHALWSVWWGVGGFPYQTSLCRALPPRDTSPIGTNGEFVGGKHWQRSSDCPYPEPLIP